ALCASCGLAGGLDSGEQQRDEDADNRDDNEQLDKREAAVDPTCHTREGSVHGGHSCAEVGICGFQLVAAALGAPGNGSISKLKSSRSLSTVILYGVVAGFVYLSTM